VLHFGLSTPVGAPVEKQEPAVSIRSSVKADYNVCLEDGKKLKMLKHHLMPHHKLEDYDAKWGLTADYHIMHQTMRSSAGSLRLRSVLVASQDKPSRLLHRRHRQ